MKHYLLSYILLIFITLSSNLTFSQSKTEIGNQIETVKEKSIKLIKKDSVSLKEQKEEFVNLLTNEDYTVYSAKEIRLFIKDINEQIKKNEQLLINIESCYKPHKIRFKRKFKKTLQVAYSYFADAQKLGVQNQEYKSISDLIKQNKDKDLSITVSPSFVTGNAKIKNNDKVIIDKWIKVKILDFININNIEQLNKSILTVYFLGYCDEQEFQNNDSVNTLVLSRKRAKVTTEYFKGELTKQISSYNIRYYNTSNQPDSILFNKEKIISRMHLDNSKTLHCIIIYEGKSRELPPGIIAGNKKDKNRRICLIKCKKSLYTKEIIEKIKKNTQKKGHY